MGVYYKHIENSGEVYYNMFNQCNKIEWIEDALDKAWESYIKDEWHYDGATFVREHENEFWEVAAFIHDWLNSIGHVGKGVDLYFIKIMIELKYSVNIIFERAKWMQWTWLNVLNHKWLKRDFKSNEIPNYLR